MSILHIGSRCAACRSVDFLPTRCPHCGQVFCGTHIVSHGCLETGSTGVAGPSTFERKAVCGRMGCDRPTIEAVSGHTDGASDIARQVQCIGCNTAFCTIHRGQDDHECPAPRSYNALGDAALLRKAKAREVMAKHFPNRPATELEKPISHTREPKRLRPASPPRLPPSVLGTSALFPPLAPVVAPVMSKTKEEKMWEIGLKKIKMSAKPLDPRQKPDGGRKFFEVRVGVTQEGEVDIWKETRKMSGSVEKVWVNADTSIGRMLDIIKDRSKVTQGDQTRLVALYSAPASERLVTPLSNSESASVIPDGSIVVLLRGS